MMEHDLTDLHVNDALDRMNQADYGAHVMIVYPDLDTLRELILTIYTSKLKKIMKLSL